MLPRRRRGLHGPVTSHDMGDTVRVKGVSNVELAGSLVAQIWRVDDATPGIDAATVGSPTVPSFKSPRSSSLELPKQVRQTRYGWYG